MRKNMSRLILAMLVLLVLVGCSNKQTSETTADNVEEPVKEEIVRDTSENDISDEKEYNYTSDAYEYQQLDSILRKLKEETE